MAMNWISNNCSNTQYVLKTDHKTVVNTYFVLDYLKKLRLPSSSEAIMCKTFETTLRLKSDEKPTTYCERDQTFILSTGLLKRIVQLSFNYTTKFMPLHFGNSFHIGIGASRINNTHFNNLTQFYINNSSDGLKVSKTTLERVEQTKVQDFFFTSSSGNTEFFEIWDLIVKKLKNKISNFQLFLP
jgi:hypothetical protein